LVVFRLTNGISIAINYLSLRQLRWEAGEGQSRVRGDLNLDGDQPSGSSVRALGSVRLSDRGRIKLQGRAQFLRLSVLRPQINYEFTLKYLRPRSSRRGFARVQGSFDHHRWSGKLDLEVERWVFGLSQIRAQGCSYFLDRIAFQELWHIKTSGRIKLFCPIRAGFVPVPYDPDRRIPHQILGILSLQLRLSDGFPRLNTELEGDAQIVLDPIHSALVEGGGQIRLHISHGVIGESVVRWKMSSFSSLHIEVPEFQRVVETFQRSPWAVPAPFHVLRGSVTLSIEGQADWMIGNFPFRLTTHLHSATQFLNLQGNGYLSVADYLSQAEWHLGVDGILTHFQIELPRLDWTLPPKLLSDSRFFASWPPDKKLGYPKFHYRISLRTQVGHPALVLTNLTRRRVPVSFQVLFSDYKRVSGLIRLASFPVEVFRRKAQMESLQLDLRDPLSASLIFGSMQTNYADYKIIIQIGATLERPQIHILSEPALPESQILSVLIFGRSLDELTSAESSSIGSTRSAIADQALGLASLYLLASTPIQSLAYNSSTGMVSAKVRLADGISLSLGTNTKESNAIDFQQRLGSNWSLQAGVESSETSRGAASASLQWSRRY
jgi:hypothetical protein